LACSSERRRVALPTTSDRRAAILQRGFGAGVSKPISTVCCKRQR
jgi:hypothetical protein